MTGSHAKCKVFSEKVEATAIQQIYGFLNCPVFHGQKIRVMPDVHAGAGAVIGFTCPVGDQVIPNVVGVDIGCFTKDTVIPLLDGTRATLQKLLQRNEPFYVYSYDIEGKRFVPRTAPGAKCLEAGPNRNCR